MLPIWCYFLIAIIGLFSCSSRSQKAVCYWFIIYIALVYFITFFVIDLLIIALFKFGLSLLLFYICSEFVCGDSKRKWIFYVGAFPLISLDILFLLWTDSSMFYYLEYIALLEPWTYEMLMVVLGAVTWETKTQAVIGSSLGIFYALYFTGLI